MALLLNRPVEFGSCSRVILSPYMLTGLTVYGAEDRIRPTAYTRRTAVRLSNKYYNTWCEERQLGCVVASICRRVFYGVRGVKYLGLGRY